MSRFRPYDVVFLPEELAVFRRAYEDACRQLGLNHSPPDPDDNKQARDALAAAIMNTAKFGERDPSALTASAVAVGMRDWNLAKK